MTADMSYYEKMFPWLWENDHDMVVHNDFDGLFSASIMSNFNNWNIIGFYDLQNVWYSKQKDLDDLRNAIWVDLDISKPHIRSIGHHIQELGGSQIAPTPKPTLTPTITSKTMPHLERSLNPNLLQSITHSNFKRKYPLGTCHFIMALKNIQVENTDLKKYLLWHPDSSWINGQKHRFYDNVEYWIESFIDIPLLAETIHQINDIEFENEIRDKLYSEIENCGFSKGGSYIESHHLKCSGYQCSFNDPIRLEDKIKKLLNFINSTMRWNTPVLPSEYSKLVGKRNKMNIHDLISRHGNIQNFIEDRDVFSYSIPFKSSINFTTCIDI
ncbi:MAG: hypothetical protein P1P69_04005 [Methanosarcinaceae archaeon]|nr:hypothetical protein [Methanosarcinaceae archaeon]MDF1533650.1 hypothetical protein [Methanosarcinaceae archaeon]